MAKKNADGLIGGSLVSEKDFIRISVENRKKVNLKAKADAELKAKAEVSEV